MPRWGHKKAFKMKKSLLGQPGTHESDADVPATGPIPNELQDVEAVNQTTEGKQKQKGVISKPPRLPVKLSLDTSSGPPGKQVLDTASISMNKTLSSTTSATGASSVYTPPIMPKDETAEQMANDISIETRTKSLTYKIPIQRTFTSKSTNSTLDNRNRYATDLDDERTQKGVSSEDEQTAVSNAVKNGAWIGENDNSTVATMKDKYRLMADGDGSTIVGNTQGQPGRSGVSTKHDRNEKITYIEPVEERGGNIEQIKNVASFGSATKSVKKAIATLRNTVSTRVIRKAKEDDSIGNWGSFSYSLDGVSYLEEDLFEVKQKYGYCSIVLCIIQLFLITVMAAVCGLAPVNVNPMLGPYPDTFSYWGGKNAYSITTEMQLWRLVTPSFLHTGFIHLLCNVAIQLETGAFFEREWGSTTWLLVYIFSGAGSVLVSSLLAPDTVSVGASGALMGLFGAKLAEVAMFSCCAERIGGEKKPTSYRMEQLSGVLCSVALVSLFSFIPFVDWSGQLGGLGFGFISGLFIFSVQIEGTIIKVIWGFFSLVCLVGCYFYSTYFLFEGIEINEDMEDICQFFRQLYREGYDCTCQDLFGHVDN